MHRPIQIDTPGLLCAGTRRRLNRGTRAGCIPASRYTRDYDAVPSRTGSSDSAVPSPELGAAAKKIPPDGIPPCRGGGAHPVP